MTRPNRPTYAGVCAQLHAPLRVWGEQLARLRPLLAEFRLQGGADRLAAMEQAITLARASSVAYHQAVEDSCGVMMSGERVFGPEYAAFTELERSLPEHHIIINRKIVNRHIIQLRLRGEAAFSDLARLRPFAALQRLELGNARDLTDLTPLGVFPDLAELKIERSQVRDLRPLAALRRLRVLDLGGSQATDATPLLACPDLVALNLSGSQLRDLGPIGQLGRLGTLVLDRLPEGIDWSPLAALINLTNLSLGGNRLEDLRMLGPLRGLQELALDNASVGSFEGLADHPDLGYIKAVGATLPPLATLPSLPDLWQLSLDGSNVTDADLTALRRFPSLSRIHLSLTAITSAEPLLELPNLEFVFLPKQLAEQSRDLNRRYREQHGVNRTVFHAASS